MIMVKIYLDPGHGGSDPGAQGNGLQEKNLTLDIAVRIRDILVNEYENVEVRMSRTGDTTVSLAQRTNDANSWGADYFLSIHINAGGGTGFESFRHTSAPAQTARYQSIIHPEIALESLFRDRGMKTANFHVLRETRMPALLTENGFIDHATDASRLQNASVRASIARGHVIGLEKAFQLRKKTNSNPGTIYRVQIGAFENRENAIQLARRAATSGFTTHIFQEDGLYKVQIGAFSMRENAEQLAQEAKNKGFDVIIVQRNS